MIEQNPKVMTNGKSKDIYIYSSRDIHLFLDYCRLKTNVSRQFSSDDEENKSDEDELSSEFV